MCNSIIRNPFSTPTWQHLLQLPWPWPSRWTPQTRQQPWWFPWARSSFWASWAQLSCPCCKSYFVSTYPSQLTILRLSAWIAPSGRGATWSADWYARRSPRPGASALQLSEFDFSSFVLETRNFAYQKCIQICKFTQTGVKNRRFSFYLPTYLPLFILSTCLLWILYQTFSNRMQINKAEKMREENRPTEYYSASLYLA